MSEIPIPAVFLVIAYFISLIVTIDAFVSSPRELKRITALPHLFMAVSASIVVVYYAYIDTLMPYAPFMLRLALLLYIVSNTMFKLTIYSHLGVRMFLRAQRLLLLIRSKWTQTR